MVTLIKNLGVSMVSPPSVWHSSELELMIVILDGRLKSTVSLKSLKKAVFIFKNLNNVSVMNEVPYLHVY